jgi:hypothetical protein
MSSYSNRPNTLFHPRAGRVFPARELLSLGLWVEDFLVFGVWILAFNEFAIASPVPSM